MKLIIAGSRNIRPSVDLIDGIIYQFNLIDITEVVTGGANGVDEMGNYWASGVSDIEPYYLGLKTKVFNADWNTHGRAAGPIRNRQMAEYGDALLLIWDGKSRGSASMKKEMEKLNKPIYEITIKEPNETK